MSYIYKITNQLNGKCYIGKTNFSIEKRWNEHKRDADKESMSHRPLYFAIRKYGSSNFIIELIEEVHHSQVNEREKYWIEYYRSFRNGYNATLGGDSKSYIDYDLVISNYNQLQNCAEVARVMNIHPDSIRNILKNNNIKILSGSQIAKNKGKSTKMYDLQNNFLQNFNSVRESAQYLLDNDMTNSASIRGIEGHISKVCKGERKTAYGFIWKYA